MQHSFDLAPAASRTLVQVVVVGVVCAVALQGA